MTALAPSGQPTLCYSPMSPFVRKVRVVAHQLGAPLALLEIDAGSYAELKRRNPLARIPTLTLADGTHLYDSPVICDYLDAMAGGGLLPAAGPERWRALHLQALADGLCDAAVARRNEEQRPDGVRRPEAVRKEAEVMGRGLDDLEQAGDARLAGFGLGEIAVACFLGYLNFRFATDNWRAGRPRLAAWFETVDRRPSMIATRPA